MRDAWLFLRKSLTHHRISSVRLSWQRVLFVPNWLNWVWNIRLVNLRIWVCALNNRTSSCRCWLNLKIMISSWCIILSWLLQFDFLRRFVCGFGDLRSTTKWPSWWPLNTWSFPARIFVLNRRCHNLLPSRSRCLLFISFILFLIGLHASPFRWLVRYALIKNFLKSRIVILHTLVNLLITADLKVWGLLWWLSFFISA